MSDDDCEKDEHGRFVHELCDVFTITPEMIAKRAADGRDPYIVAVRIYKLANSGRGKVRIDGEYLPEHVNTKSVLKQWGPGRYEFQGVNQNGQFITNATMALGSIEASDAAHGLNAAEPGPAPTEALPPPVGPPGVDPMFAYMMQQSAQAQAQSQQMMMGVLQVMGQALVGQQPPANDGMSKLAEAIAASSAATAASFSAHAQSPQAQATASQTSFMENIVMKALDGAKSGSDGIDTTQILLAMLADKDQDGKFWESIFPVLVENLGIPVMGAIATALPEDKGKMLSALLAEQAKARAAEANADAAEAAAAGGTVDTEGVAAE